MDRAPRVDNGLSVVRHQAIHVAGEGLRHWLLVKLVLVLVLLVMSLARPRLIEACRVAEAKVEVDHVQHGIR